MKKISILSTLLLSAATTLFAQPQPIEIITEIGSLQHPDWDSLAHDYITYNSDNLKHQQFTWYRMSPGWEQTYKQDYYYTSDGLLTETRGFQMNLSSWMETGRSLHTWNANDEQLTYEYQQKVGNDWVPDSRYSNTYAGNPSLLDQKLWGMWDEPSQLWNDNYKDVFTYDGNGNTATSTGYIWTSGAWRAANRTTYTYTAANEVDVAISQSSPNGIEWEFSGKDVNTWNSDNQLVTTQSFTFDDALSFWVPNRRIEYTYNADGTADQVTTTEYDYQLNAWKNVTRVTYIYPEVLGTDDQQLAAFQLYPNPAQSEMTVAFEHNGPSALSVSDLTGKVLLSVLHTQGMQHTLSLNGLLSGNYLIRVETGESVEVRAFVKL